MDREETTRELLLRLTERRDDPLDAAQRQEVGEGAVGHVARESQHAFAQRGEDDRHRLRRWRGELEPAGAALAGEHGAQVAHGLVDLRERAAKSDAVPLLHDDVRRRAEAEDETPVADVSQRGGSLGEEQIDVAEDRAK